MESLHPRDVELRLDRMHPVAARLELARAPCAVITVGGTNGKGSTVAFLEHCLHAAGYRVGAYTSPHLLRYNERVRVATRDATDAELIASFEAVEAARQTVPLTYFEFGTLAAMQHFRARRTEIAVLEVGLGGRLDAVNLWDADVSIVTSIGIDHTEWLGATRDSIGREKAGIFRQDRPAIVGDPDPPASLVAHAREIGARALRYGADFQAERQAAQWNFRAAGVTRSGLAVPAMRGSYQLRNAACALMALECLRDRFPVTQSQVRQGLATAVLPGRFQTLPGLPLRVLDVAHNAEAVAVLADNLRAQPVARRTLAVCGMLQDKPVEEVARLLAPLVHEWFVAGLAGARGMTAETLAERLRAAGVQAPLRLHGTVADAWRAAVVCAQPDDRVLGFGSFHTVGDILAAVQRDAGEDRDGK
jgi:dihydrofolate synthase/folylpolyglutamate synthase